MNSRQLEPIETKRIDPTNGQEYTFTMPTFNLRYDLYTQLGIPEKEFALSFLGWLVCFPDEQVNHPDISDEAKELLPLLNWAILSLSLSVKLIKSEDKESFDYDYGITYDRAPKTSPTPGIERSPSPELMQIVAEEVLNSQVLMLAMVDYLHVNRVELGRRAREELDINEPDYVSKSFDADAVGSSEGSESETATKANRLFPNSKDLDLKIQWAMPQFLANNINRGIKAINREEAKDQYEKSGTDLRGRDKKAAFKIQNKKSETETEFIFDQEKAAIKSADQFADQLIKMKDANVLQVFFSLMKKINMNDTPVFHNVPISEIMEIVLKPSGNCKFNTAQRRAFSDGLEYLATVAINLSIIGERVNKKTGKSKPVLREERGVKLFRIVPEYSVKKEFQSIPKDLLKDMHFDKTVITRFSGEILPGNARFFGERGSVYFDSLLHLDANKDSKAFVLGFALQTRFNQLKQKATEMDRGYLVDLCDYQKTDKTKPSKATKQLVNCLEKLKSVGIISKYEGLTNKNEDVVRIYPPRQKELN